MENQNIETSEVVIQGEFLLAGYHGGERIVAAETVGRRSLLKDPAADRFLPIFHYCECFGGSGFQQHFLSFLTSVPLSLALVLHTGRVQAGTGPHQLHLCRSPSRPVPSHCPHSHFLFSLPLSLFPSRQERCVSVLPCVWGILCDQVLAYIFGLRPLPNSPLTSPM